MITNILNYFNTDPVGFIVTTLILIGAVYGLKFSFSIIVGAINMSKNRKD